MVQPVFHSARSPKAEGLPFIASPRCDKEVLSNAEGLPLIAGRILRLGELSRCLLEALSVSKVIAAIGSQEVEVSKL